MNSAKAPGSPDGMRLEELEEGVVIERPGPDHGRFLEVAPPSGQRVDLDVGGLAHSPILLVRTRSGTGTFLTRKALK